jgi:hypothetical protein
MTGGRLVDRPRTVSLVSTDLPSSAVDDRYDRAVKLPAARIAVLVALGCGCGITVVGALDPLPVDGIDGGSEAGAALPEGGGLTDALADAGEEATTIDIAPLDASFDANPVNCAAACEGGICDGGWCTITCGPAQCQNAPVVCPPGVPCAVSCKANGSCNQGVDCTAATACDVRCTGDSTCVNGKVACTGAGCSVKCSGKGSCNNGVQCDAGACAIGCTGESTCENSTIDCHSDTCQVVCGDGTGKGKGSCNNGVRCISSQSCDITCQDQDTCENGRIVAVAGTTADIRCTGLNSCNNGVFTSAEDGGAFCKSATCGQGIFCDGGACNARCDGTNLGVCCKATACRQKTNNCSFTSCP